MHMLLRISRRISYLSLGSLFLVMGCGPFTPVPLEPSAIQGVEEIAVTGPSEPDRYDTYDTNQILALALTSAAMGAASPIAGQAATASGTAAIHDMSFSDIAQKERFAPGREEQDALVSALRSDGYRVVTFSAPRNEVMIRHNFASNYNAAPATAQLILDTSLDLGYTNNVGKDFNPDMFIEAKLIDRASGKILMVKQFRFHAALSDGPKEDSISDPSCEYKSLEDLNHSPQRAIDCMRQGINALAHQVADQLRH